MRRKMFSFIEHQVLDLTAFANPALFLGDIHLCKSKMYGRARGMDLDEYVMRTRMYLCMCAGGASMHIHLQMLSNCEHIDELTSQIPCSYSNQEIQHIPSEILQHLNVSITCSTELHQIQHQNASYLLYLPFTDEMCTQLNHRLIEETTSLFVAVHRRIIESHRTDPWIDAYDIPARRASMGWKRAANWKTEHDCMRANFLTRAGLEPPQVLRVIDIEATCNQRERVVLIDYLADATVQQRGYSAISHTYGMPVYKAFDCCCASESSAKVPRCSKEVCPHQDEASSGSQQQKRVVNDILRMCDILRKAGVKYAWHDGVCIAQHDDAEVEETIKHIGWIYAYGQDTIIFLHYVGSPMAPIRNSHDKNELCCRWHTRVWTLQEGAFSKCRRYCVRVGPLGDCQSLEEFEEKMAVWYGDNTSTIEVMEEDRFYGFVKEIRRVLSSLLVNRAKKVLSIPDDADDDVIVESNWMWIKASAWAECITDLLATLLGTCFEFPTMETVLFICCGRDSKHRGDRMNSILAFAEVKDFVAQKDENVEASTIEFFERQGQLGLATAVFSINRNISITDKEYITEERQHTWPPILWSSLIVYQMAEAVAEGIGFKVLEDGRMELRAELICVEVRFIIDEHKNCVKTGEDTDELVLPYDLTCLDMDLTRLHMGSEFKASISECITGEVYISAIEKCNSQTPVVSCEIKDGDSFHAYLVIPIGMARRCLIVQGTLDAHVSKVGVFIPTQKFLQQVNVEHSVEIMEKLIIT